MKSLKKKSGQATSKKYVYSDNLQFLLKIVQKYDTVSSIEETQLPVDSDEEEQIDTEQLIEPLKRADNKKSNNPRKKARLQQDIDREILKALSISNTQPDEDEAFFISVTPDVRRMCEEDKLEFRMSVLMLIKDINNRRKNCPTSEPTFYNSSASRTSTPISCSSSMIPSPYSNEQSDCLHAQSPSCSSHTFHML